MVNKKFIIIHNPRCRKSREALAALENSSSNIEIRKYLEDKLSRNELKNVLKKLNMKAEDLVRKTEPVFKENYKNKELSQEEWITAMVIHPKLIQRPIVIAGPKAVIARTPQALDEVI